MGYILLSVSVLVFLASLILQIVMTASYRKEAAWLTMMMGFGINVTAYESSLRSIRKKFRLATAFLSASMTFGLSSMGVIWLNMHGDLTCLTKLYFYNALVILEVVSIIISSVLITIIQYKRSRFE